MLRTIAASYWTASVLGIVALVLHVRWYTVDKAAGGEVVSGFGAALVVIGVLVAARPFLRTGLRGMAEQTVQAPQFGGWADEAYVKAGWDAYRKRVDAAMPDVFTERVLAVAVIAFGTLLNGYGPLIARALHFR